MFCLTDSYEDILRRIAVNIQQYYLNIFGKETSVS